MKKKVLSILLIICMLISMLPSAAFATEAEPVYTETLTLPVVPEGEELPEPQGYGGGVSVFSLTQNNTSYAYAYEGVTYASLSMNERFTFTVDEGVTPTSGGVVQIVDADGKVLAGSQTISYYETNDDAQVWYFWNAYFSDETADAGHRFADIPAGVYDLQIAVNDERYAVDQKLCVVDSESLLIAEAYAYLYYDSQTAEVRLEIYGLKSEDDLAKMSMTLTDADGVTIARSTGAYREFNHDSYYGCWRFYMELALESGQQLTSGNAYSLTISDTSERLLVDGVGGVTGYTSSHSTELGDVQFSDAQNGVLSVELRYPWDNTTYDVVISDDRDQTTVYGSWTGTVPENGLITIPLTMNGMAVSADNYSYSFYVSWKSSDYSYWNCQSVENPYGNTNSGNAWFYPSVMSPAYTTQPFTLQLNDFDAYKGDGTDVLTMCADDGTQVASCTNLTETDWNGSQIYLAGTLTIPENLEETRYYLYLNGEELDWVSVSTVLSQSRDIEYWNYNTNTFWTNFGVLPIQIENLNFGANPRMELRDAEGKVCATTGVMNTSAGEYAGYMIHTGTFKQVDLAQCAGTELSLWYVDDEHEHLYEESCYYDATVSDIVFYSSDNYNNACNVQVRWWDLEAGATTAEVYCYGYDAMRNVTEAALLERLGDLRLVCGETTLTVTGMTLSGDPNDYHSATLSGAITAGDWVVYDGTTQLDTFTVYVPDGAESLPYISGEVNSDGWYIWCQNLLMDHEYTAKIYQNYTCITEEFPLTLQNNEDNDQQFLRLPKSVINGLDRGEYEVRVYQNDALLGSVAMSVTGALQPTITLWDSNGMNWSDRIIHGKYMGIEVAGDSSWQFYRHAESEDALASANWIEVDSGYRLTDTETVGERTLYVQLSTDANGTTVSDVVELPFLYLGEDGLLDVYVHEEVEGLYSGDSVALSLGADYPYAHAMVELVDADGNVECIKLNYQGQGELLAPNDAMIESAHPYSANMDKTWEYTLEGAESIEVTFSDETYVQWHSDYLYVYYVNEAGEDVLYNSYTGNSLAGDTLTLPGDTVKVRLTSDSYSNSSYGFRVVSVVDPDAAPEVDDGASYHIYATTLNTADYLGTEKLFFYLVENGDDENGYRNSLVSEVVERSLIFGDPTEVILPQFSDNDGYVLTNKSAYTIYGYGIPGSTVTLTYPGEDEAIVTLGTATASTNGKFTIELTDLADGVYSFTATSKTDDKTIYGDGTLEVDTTPPEITAMGFAFSDSDTATLNWTCTDSDLYRSMVYLVTEDGEQRLGSYIYTSSGNNGVYARTVTASMNDGQKFKVVVEDNAGNKGSRTISTSDQELPTAPGELTYTDRTASSVTLNWTAGTDNVGVAGYNIYMNGEKIGQTTGESVLTYNVTGLEQGAEYTFSVATRDLAENLSADPNPELKVSTAKLSLDAAFPSTVTTNGSDAVSVTVSAVLASDVEDYTPYMEELSIRYQAKGDTAAPVEDQWVEQALSDLSLTGSQGKGTWTIEVPADAELPLTYWVQVVAADGDDATAYSAEETLTLVDGRVTFTVKDSQTGNIIPGASVSVYQDGELKLSGAADSEGKVLLGLEDGSYSLMVTADGYQMRSVSSVTISADRLEFTIYMNSEDILQVETTVKEMTYDEIVAAGIDPAAAGNQQVYECTAILDFVPITYVCAGDQVIQGDPVKVGDYVVYPAARDIFLIVPTQTTWLKEMFDVQLLVTNSSAFEDVEDCVATLNLPQGLSLAEMATGIQSQTAQLGTIAPGGSASHHWYVRGDVEGDYNLQGTVTGKRVGGGISEDISVGFTTQDPISVLAGSAMKLTIEAEKTATVGQPYNMRFTLQNVSNKSLYNVNFDVLGGTFRQEYTIEDVLASYDLEGPFQSDADNSNLKNGFVLSAAEFKPADVLSGVFTITFAEGIDDPDAVKYMLKQVFLFTGAGSTTEIPTEVIWVDTVDHAHSYDEGKVTKEATCTEDGEKTYTCTDTDCGDTFTVDIPATGHKMGAWTTIKAATCTETGSAESSCTNTGCTYTDTMTLNAMGHSYAEEWTTDLEPTCTEEGSKSRHCIRCDAKADVTVIPENGHSFGDWEKHNADQHKRICGVETCKFEEYAGHTWNDGEQTTAPTHLELGVKTYTCTTEGCGETKTEDIDKLPDHIWGDWEKISDTQHQRSCPCGSTETADHTWSDGVVTTEPELNKEGERTYTCSICNGTKTEVMPALQEQEMYFSTNLLGQNMVKTYGDYSFVDQLFNEDVDAPVLTFTSSDESVATVDENGWVTIKGAGETTISATSAAVPYQYVETTASYKLVVNKAELTITANDVTIDYGEVFAPDGYTANGFVYDETADVLSCEIAYTSDYAQYGTAGEYAVNVSGFTSDNYNITFVSGKLTVRKVADYTITFGNLSQKSGNVTAVTVAIEPQDATAVIKLEYKVGGQWTTTLPTAVGTYPVRAQLTASENITLDGKLYGDQLVIEAVDSIGGVSVSVKTEGEGDSEKATVQVTDEEVTQIVESLDATNGDLAVNLESVAQDTLALPGNLIEELNKSDALDTVTVATENSSISMSDSVVETMADTMDKEDTVSLEMRTVEMGELDDEQKNALESIGGPSPMTVVLELKLVVTGADGEVKKEIKELGDKVDITIQCSQEMKGKRMVACYISPDGTVTYLVAKYDEAANTLSFKTDHFSHYAAVALDEGTNVVYVVDENGVEQPVVGAGPQTVGATVTIQAPDAPSGYRFSGWQVVEGTVTLANATSASTTFTMPEEDVVLKAMYSRTSSVGSGIYMPIYGLTVDKTSNGTVTLSSMNASNGSTVTITINPDKGYELENLLVLDKNGDEVKVTKKSDTVYTFIMPSSKVAIEATFAEIGSEIKNPFVDVSEGAYYYDAVLWAVENGITGGTSATTFSPAVACTRAQTVTFLWRLAGSPEPITTVCLFEDVDPSAYYYDALLWAVENGITSGTSATTFSPGATVTRAQNVTFLWRLAESPATVQANRFVDVTSDAYYHDAVIWAAEEQITTGITATTFGPNDPCLRSQIVTFLYRYAKD